MPAKRRTTVEKNGRVDRLTSGTTAASENGGRTVAPPDAIQKIAKKITMTAGMIPPRMTPTLLNYVEASSPKYAMRVVPQKVIIITLNM